MSSLIVKQPRSLKMEIDTKFVATTGANWQLYYYRQQINYLLISTIIVVTCIKFILIPS